MSHITGNNALKPRRVHKPAEEREVEILTAATKVFAASGYRGAEVQAVADRAGVGKGTVYRHFPSKEELFTETLRFNLDTLKTEMEAARDAQQRPLEKLRESMRAYMQYFERNPDVIELFVQERAEFRDGRQMMYYLYAEAGREEWKQLYVDIAAEHELRHQDPEALMDACGDLMQGAVAMGYSPLPRAPLSQRFELLFDIYLHGILVQPPEQ